MKFTAAIYILPILLVSTASGAVRDASRYDVIVSRNIFWNPPKRVVPVRRTPTRPTPLKRSFVESITMCGITETKNGIRVGFFASTPRVVRGRRTTAQKSYYLFVGEKEDEIEVISADFAEEKAQLRKGTETGWIYMNKPAGVSGSTSIAPAPGPVVRRPAPALRTTSYRDIVRRRREAEAKRRAAEMAKPRLTGEARLKHLQEYNMNLIRAKGEKGPPLPMQLTPEQDAQLVDEGVLSPRE